MNIKRILQYVKSAYFSKPKADRAVYRLIAQRKPRRIVEIGLGDGQRVPRLISFAQSYLQDDDTLQYAAIDLFEARPAEATGPSYKEAHRLLAGSEAKVQLIPGDPYAALSRWANSLPDTDLLILAADLDESSLAAAWFFVPRMLSADAVVLRATKQADGSLQYQPVSQSQIQQWASRRQETKSAA